MRRARQAPKELKALGKHTESGEPVAGERLLISGYRLPVTGSRRSFNSPMNAKEEIIRSFS